MKKKPPANDGREWTTDDWWYTCACGSPNFHILWRSQLAWVICAKCEADNTGSIFDGTR